MKRSLFAAAAVFALVAVPAQAQRARSMYSVEGASSAPTTTKFTKSPLEGTWVGTVNDKNGGTRTLSIAFSGVSGGFARINRDNGDSGTGRVSGNSVSFGTRTPMTLTV